MYTLHVQKVGFVKDNKILLSYFAEEREAERQRRLEEELRNSQTKIYPQLKLFFITLLMAIILCTPELHIIQM